jgi:outer membrane protein OmpA-like peptidoglycan-associated protein
MKFVPVVPALAALLVAACAANSKQATSPQRAAEHAEEEKHEAQEQAQDARRDASKAQQESQEATRTQREADQNAHFAAQRAAQAEAQAAQPPAAPRGGTTERQAESARARIAEPSVYFAANGADLSADAKVKLDDVAKGLGNNAQGRKVVIEGYADDTGAESDNVELSHHRADAVANYLESKGVRSERITTKGFGSHNLASKEETNHGRALNRRVEIAIQPAVK